MRIVSVLKPVLFIYECVRIAVLIFTLALRLPLSYAILWLVFTANGVLFPLMALFIWLDVSRYRAYMPLFISGKCISIFSLLGWFIVFVKGNIIEVISGVFIASDFVFLCGDLIALAFIVLILTDTQKLIEKQEPARRQEVLKGAGNTEENNENNSNSQR